MSRCCRSPLAATIRLARATGPAAVTRIALAGEPAGPANFRYRLKEHRPWLVVSQFLHLLALPLLSVGCGDYPPLPDVIVHSGQSIQQALDQMPASVDTWFIKVRPGVYKETLSVDRLGVTLMGEVTGAGPEDRPVLDGSLDGGKLRKDAVIVQRPALYEYEALPSAATRATASPPPRRTT